ncbi:MAG: TraB/GumN family protein [Haloarculaceae archaeon]
MTAEGEDVASPPAPDGARLPEARRGDGQITLVGTAHVSQESVDEVERTIDERDPDVVAVELDEGRYDQLKGEEPDDIDARDVLSGNTLYQFLAYWMLSYVQTRLGDRFDIEPGADMLADVEAAEARGAGVALVDRDIQLTMQRLWKRMRFREKLRMAVGGVAELGDPLTAGLSVGFLVGVFVAFLAEALAGPFVFPPGFASGVGVPVLGGLLALVGTVLDGLLVAGFVAVLVGLPVALLFGRSAGDVDYDELEISDLTDTDVVSAMMEEFRHFSPGAAGALIDERDAFIAHRLLALRAAGYDVVAVVGAGHQAGVQAYLDDPDSLPPVESLVGAADGSRLWSLLYRALGYAFTLGFLAFFLLLAIAGVRGQFLLELFAAWFLVNGIVSFALARTAGAHLTSASVGGAVAWLTSVNPLLAPGWFAGYVELRYIDVNVADIGRLNEILDDEEAPLRELLGRMQEVPLFRLIAIVAMTNVGSFIASMVFAFVLLPHMSAPVGGVGGIADQMLEGAARSAEFLWGLLV